MSSSPSKILEVFDNPNSERDFVIRIDSSEFTCLCPLTGQPDFADIHIEYIADKLCVELKALKNYFWSYRNEGAFHEAVTNKILDDLVDSGKTIEVVRAKMPKAHYATIYSKPMGRPQVDTYITEVSQDTWIFFPWDMALQYVEPYRGTD